MKRIQDAIEDLKKDYNSVIYDLGNLIGYVKKDWDQELAKKDSYDKRRNNDLYNVVMDLLKNLTDAVNPGKYGYEDKSLNLLDKLEDYYHYASLEDREKAKETLEKAEKAFIEKEESKEDEI